MLLLPAERLQKKEVRAGRARAVGAAAGKERVVSSRCHTYIPIYRCCFSRPNGSKKRTGRARAVGTAAGKKRSGEQSMLSVCVLCGSPVWPSPPVVGSLRGPPVCVGRLWVGSSLVVFPFPVASVPRLASRSRSRSRSDATHLSRYISCFSRPLIAADLFPSSGSVPMRSPTRSWVRLPVLPHSRLRFVTGRGGWVHTGSVFGLNPRYAN